MTKKKKTWILRLGSIPVLFLLPFIGAMIAVAITGGILGNRDPLLELCLGLFLGFGAAIFLSFGTLFASKKNPLKPGWCILAAVVAFEHFL